MMKHRLKKQIISFQRAHITRGEYAVNLLSKCGFIRFESREMIRSNVGVDRCNRETVQMGATIPVAPTVEDFGPGLRLSSFDDRQPPHDNRR
jgi:hypothetical protein